MTDSASHPVRHRHHLSVLERLATLLAWSLALVFFLTVGRLAMEPDDPQGAVSLLGRAHPGLMLLQVMALAAVSAALATAIAGRCLADIGTFSTSVAMAAVSVQGGTAPTLLWAESGSAPALLGKLAVESAGWFCVVAVAMLVSALVYRWFFGADGGAVGLVDERGVRMSPWTQAGFEVPLLRRFLSGGHSDLSTDRMTGIKHTIIGGAASLAAAAVLSAGLYSRSVQHGQSCFVVIASVWIGVQIASRWAPVRSALWPVLSVAVLTAGAYIWAAVQPGDSSLPSSIPRSHFLRILPVQYIAVGVASAIGTFWYVFEPEVTHPPDVSRRQSLR